METMYLRSKTKTKGDFEILQPPDHNKPKQKNERSMSKSPNR